MALDEKELMGVGLKAGMACCGTCRWYAHDFWDENPLMAFGRTSWGTCGYPVPRPFGGGAQTTAHAGVQCKVWAGEGVVEDLGL